MALKPIPHAGEAGHPQALQLGLAVRGQLPRHGQRQTQDRHASLRAGSFLFSRKSGHEESLQATC